MLYATDDFLRGEFKPGENLFHGIYQIKRFCKVCSYLLVSIILLLTNELRQHARDSLLWEFCKGVFMTSHHYKSICDCHCNNQGPAWHLRRSGLDHPCWWLIQFGHWG